VIGVENKNYTVKDIYARVEKMVGGNTNKIEDVITFGEKDSSVNKILVCWMSDIAAINYAAKTGADLIISHESPFFPYNVNSTGGIPEFMTWHSNRNRIKLLVQNNIKLIRMHGPLDIYCIYDEFAAVLGLGEPIVTHAPTIKVYEIAPIPYGDLIRRVKKAVGMSTLRASGGDPKRVVKRIGLPCGGFGLFVNVEYMQIVLDIGCEVLIAGETDSYGIRFAIDAGVDMIETGHEISENPGLRKFAAALGEHIPEIPVEFYENKPPFIFI